MKEARFLPFGTSCLYSCVSKDKMLFSRSSQGATVLSENYVMTTLFHGRQKLSGFRVSGLFNEAIGGEIFVSFNCKPDLVLFGTDAGDKTTCILYFYDGYRWHIEDRADEAKLHQKECQFYDGTNGLERSNKLVETLALTDEFHQQMRTLLEGMYDKVCIVRETWCQFHNPYSLGDITYENPYDALYALSKRCSDMMIPVEFPKHITLDDIFREMRAPPSPEGINFHSGFCTVSGYVPLRSRDPFFGQCISKKFVREEELLTPKFIEMMNARLSVEFPNVPLEQSRKAFLKNLLSTRKLLASHSFKNNTVALSYLLYLRDNFDFVITSVDHILLYSLQRHASLKHLPLARFVNKLQILRDSFTARKNALSVDRVGNKREIARLEAWSAIVKVGTLRCSL